MITALDTCILLDVLGGDPQYGAASGEALRHGLRKGRLVVCDVVWAETAAHFPDDQSIETALRDLGAAFSPMDPTAAAEAGKAWRGYRRAGGPRSRMIADFLIAGHALIQCDQLLTRDRGFFRRYFPKLTVIEPGGA